MTAGPSPIAPSVNAWNAEYLESQYAAWKADAGSVSAELAQFFTGFELGLTRTGGADRSASAAAPTGAAMAASVPAAIAMRDLIDAYRRFGHIEAATDPFGRAPKETHPLLNPAAHGIEGAMLDQSADAGVLSTDGRPMTLRDAASALRQTYCGSVGVEFMHLTSEAERAWIVDRFERARGRGRFSDATKRRILTQLYKAELWEKFCAKKYVGVKRFSLEGGDALIPMLDAVLERAGDHDVVEVVMGMAHRGRLNVLTNIVGKTYQQIFTEFEDAWDEDVANGGGDVKYHRGFSEKRALSSNKSLWVSMASNPSHLESVDPVVLGRARAKQRQLGDFDRRKIVPVLIHGDAAFIGQGVVAETFNLGQLEGYHVGGCVHVVTNNLIGFTTGEEDARTSRYCTDVAKIVEVPIFHVSGEDPEACVFVAEMALDFRMTFRKDVVIDVVCYRRHGHNETDEAAFTQPLLYAEIKAKPTVLRSYADTLLNAGVIDQEMRDSTETNLFETLEQAWAQVKQTPVDPTPEPGHQRWKGQSGTFSFDPVNTAVPREVLDRVAQRLGQWPEGFTPHHKLVKILEERARSVRDDLPIDWGTAENLAVGSLLLDGAIVRLSGQDCRRGTFSHRHAALRDVNNGALFVPLTHIKEELGPHCIKPLGARDANARSLEGRYWVYDSALSEYAVLGFEYGYSLTSPNVLVMWEAQFGDFSNGAQIIIDQYLASAEIKWHRWSGLVMLLPHGYEGQGPEHSSARLERFLQLCGDNNMQVCHPTTPAQHFHMLRRQVNPARNFRKPLVVMTPKSLLRLPAAASKVSELTSGTFQEVLDDPIYAGKDRAARAGVKRVILCSGKVYYDLVARRAEVKRSDLAIVRLEQLYPLHFQLVREVTAQYPKDVELVWVQEEPKNMGAYSHVYMNFAEEFGWELPYIGRRVSATPATGSHHKHAEQLEELLTEAVGTTGKPIAVGH
jgi:2-oxoglutarate dehydrogenase E1 component